MGTCGASARERERYFVRGGRDKAVVDTVLGADFSGVLVTDFYAAYDHYPGPHQRCWAHLLRAIHELVARHPADAALAGWATRCAASTRGRGGSAARIPPCGERAQRSARPSWWPCASRIWRRRPRLCPRRCCAAASPSTCPSCSASSPIRACPATNNAAERSVRPVVIQRKISGGTRSAQGTTTFTTPRHPLWHLARSRPRPARSPADASSSLASALPV